MGRDLWTDVIFTREGPLRPAFLCSCDQCSCSLLVAAEVTGCHPKEQSVQLDMPLSSRWMEARGEKARATCFSLLPHSQKEEMISSKKKDLGFMLSALTGVFPNVKL